MLDLGIFLIPNRYFTLNTKIKFSLITYLKSYLRTNKVLSCITFTKKKKFNNNNNLIENFIIFVNFTISYDILQFLSFFFFFFEVRFYLWRLWGKAKSTSLVRLGSRSMQAQIIISYIQVSRNNLKEELCYQGVG